MTGPSASGSENGIPTSSTSAPAWSSPHRISAERNRSGSPAVTYVTRPVRFSARMRSNAAESLDANFGTRLHFQILRHALNIFVASARQIDEDVRIGTERLRERRRIRDGVRRFERGDDAFGPGELLKSGERIFVADPRVLGSAEIFEPRVFWPDGRVVEAG